MSIPYIMNIPATNDNPSNDQPNMEINNNAIAQFVAVDHVAFGVSGMGQVSGQHNQVTFNGNNVPAAPTAPPVLFTNIQDGNGNNLPGPLAQLFFYSGSNLKGSTQFASVPNGSVLLLGGIVMKWGPGALTGAAGQTAFVNAFPNACFVVLITGTSTLYQGGFVATNVTPTGFTAVRTSGAGNTGFYYIAIGN